MTIAQIQEARVLKHELSKSEVIIRELSIKLDQERQHLQEIMENMERETTVEGMVSSMFIICGLSLEFWSVQTSCTAECNY